MSKQKCKTKSGELLMQSVELHIAKLLAERSHVQALEANVKSMADDARRRTADVQTLCNLVMRIRNDNLFKPSPEFAEVWFAIRQAMKELGYCENCGTVQCGCDNL